MKFRTEINPGTSKFEVQYKDPVLLIGSCFTVNVGKKLEEVLFHTNINPFGVVYNPLSVKRSLEIIISEKQYKESELNYFNELWYSWDHHSSFSGPDRSKVLEHINHEIKNSNIFLRKARYLFISFGTSWVYRLKKTNEVVCNCHKVPAREFGRELLEIADISKEYQKLVDSLLEFNPDLKIIFTVSPVRHWKDGAHSNQLSKSILHLAVDEILKRNDKTCDYFPSYEIMMDDLRDYRFFSDDMLHPNDQAIEYIWEKFSQAYFRSETKSQIVKVEELVKASNHRLMDPESNSSRKFKQKYGQKLKLLQDELPEVNWKRISGSF
jgi:hypothetical protein